MVLQWDPSLSVNNPLLDREHQTLIQKVNELNQLTPAEVQAQFGDLVEFLVDYAKKHFTDEEAYFTAHGFPQAQEHIARHDSFLEEVKLIIEQYQQEGYSPELVTKLYDFLTTWMHEHLKTADQEYAAYIAGTGQK